MPSIQTSPLSALSSSGRYLPQFDGMRGIAALSVVVAHFNPAPLRVPPGSAIGLIMKWWARLALGNLAVAFFFALSAFLLTYLACREFRATGTISIRRFFARRLLRVWPLYFFVLLVAYLLNSPRSPLPSAHVASAQTWEWLCSHVALYAFFVSNWSLTFNHFGRYVDPSDGPLRILWSIAVEEQFYVIYPWLVLLVLHRPSAWRWIVFPALVLGWGFRIWFTHLLPDSPGISSAGGMYYATFSYLDILLAGSIAGWLAARTSSVGTQIWARRPWFGLTTVICCLGAGLLWANNLWYPYNLVSVGIYLILGLTFASFLFWASGQENSPLIRFLGSRPLRLLGEFSYGIYLWHLISNACLATVLEKWSAGSRFAASPACLLIASLLSAIAFAAAGRWLIEKPFLRLKQRYGPRPQLLH
jgi:peptidoglycan/LPS O-acetylase OafA/YrhL